jgi:hypothetical protein
MYSDKKNNKHYRWIIQNLFEGYCKARKQWSSYVIKYNDRIYMQQ